MSNSELEQRTADPQLKAGILKAADFIEANPNQFDFGETDVPHTCDSPGCALGWIHHFSGIKGVAYGRQLIQYVIDAEHLFGHGVSDQDFYDRMTELVGTAKWRDEAALCAKGLRLYAEKFV